MRVFTVSDCDGPTERLLSLLDRLLKPIKKRQVSYLETMRTFIKITHSHCFNGRDTSIYPEFYYHPKETILFAKHIEIEL